MRRIKAEREASEFRCLRKRSREDGVRAGNLVCGDALFEHPWPMRPDWPQALVDGTLGSLHEHVLTPWSSKFGYGLNERRRLSSPSIDGYGCPPATALPSTQRSRPSDEPKTVRSQRSKAPVARLREELANRALGVLPFAERRRGHTHRVHQRDEEQSGATAPDPSPRPTTAPYPKHSTPRAVRKAEPRALGRPTAPDATTLRRAGSDERRKKACGSQIGHGYVKSRTRLD